MVVAFYDRRGGRLAWSESGPLSSRAVALVCVLAGAREYGLDPENYPTPDLAPILPWRSAFQGATLDSILTRAFLAFASDLSRGRVRPEKVDRSWRGSEKDLDLVRVLEETLIRGDIADALWSIAPTHPGYLALQRALLRYRELADSRYWLVIPPGPALRPGASDPRVPLLRRRLHLEDFGLTRLVSEEALYDSALVTAVRDYQQARGLAPDGVVGDATMASLNISPADRVRQITMNLERWRWLPRSLERPYVMVNTAGFVLDFVMDEANGLSSRAIVGRRDWPTPIVSSSITDLRFRPTWSVPRSIAMRELLPLIKRNPDYLRQQGFRVFNGKAEVDLADVEWRTVSRRSWVYRFVQEPGPENPLGSVKFVFGTPFGVYLHDTPARTLFERYPRWLSHGCVRIERAAELAARLTGWPLESVHLAMRTGRNDRVTLPKAVPVHLVYWTAWVDSAGVLQFRDDGYGWDALLNAALAPPPAQAADLIAAQR